MAKLLLVLILCLRSKFLLALCLTLYSKMLKRYRNTQLLRRLPSGFTATATVQVAGRGRGTNVWVSPAGSLMFSLVVRHDVSLMSKAPVVFLQYLAALAIVEGIQSYDIGYRDFPIKLKWPNDICEDDLLSSFPCS